MSDQQCQEWQPERKTVAAMNAVGLVATLLALIGFAALYALANPAGGTFGVTLSGLFWGILGCLLFIVLLMVVHELLHGCALRTLGYKPTYGFTMVGGSMPAFYCTSQGALLSKAGFTYVALLPGIVLAIIPAVWILMGWPYSGWWIVPAGILLGGAVGDWFMTATALKAPAGARIEDNKDGLLIHAPTRE